MTQKTRTRATLLTLMGLVALQIPVATLLALLLPDASVNPEVNYVASALLTVVMYGLPGWLLTPTWHGEDDQRGKLALWSILAAGAACVARLVATPLNAWWTGLVNAPVSAIPQAEGPLGTALMLLAVVALPALAEELFFRGALLTNLLQAGSRWQAVLLTTLMFALLHGSLAGLPGHLLISLLLTLLMMHSGRLVVPIIAHMAYNLLALPGWRPGPAVLWIAGGLLLALLAALTLRLPRGKTRRLPVEECLLCGMILAAMALRYLI